MKAIVVYKSKTGFTKKYAKWIQEELRCDLLEEKKVTVKKLKGYDVIVFGSYIRVEKIWGIKKLLGQVGTEDWKKVVLFSTGSSAPDKPERIEGIWKKSGLEKQASEIPHFYMQSGLNYEKMNLVEQVLMKAFAKIMDKKVGKGSVSSTSFDVSSKEYIVPLIQCVRERENGSKK